MVLDFNSALIVGCARSGIASARVLNSLGVKVLLNDIKTEDNFKDAIAELSNTEVSFLFGCKPDALIDHYDIIVISPGVPMDSGFVSKALRMGKEVISEVELAYRLCKAPVYAITGTNGKTTTTALLGEIFKASGKNTYVVGNIGIPFIEKSLSAVRDDAIIAEISSFQLEGIKKFKPEISAILNITEDHLNRHKTLDNYISIKGRIFENANSNDFLVLNADDPVTSTMGENTQAQKFYFSRKKALDEGAWIEDNKIVIGQEGSKKTVCSTYELQMPGLHNLENALAASLIASLAGIDEKIIGSVLKTFKGMEHRLEKVAVINNITFYNDSKGTNPDSSIKAIEAMSAPTILIAGGMDKDSDFNLFIDSFGTIIKELVLLGETAERIEKTAKDKGFTNTHIVNDLREAVEKAFQLAKPGDNVLLSPACASWDMFEDYEERGRIFKETVRGLRG